MQVKKLNSNDQQALTELIDITEANLRDKVFWYPISDTSREHFLDDKWTNFFGIFDQNKLIAAAGLFYNDNEYGESAKVLHLGDHNIAEIGRIMTRPEYQHKGYMNIILSEIVKYAQTISLDYLIATVHPQNTPSYKALEKIGMHKKAHCIKHETYERDILVLNIHTKDLDKAYFSDMTGVRPIHYECVVGGLYLPWSGQTIMCYKDTNGPVPQYTPDIPQTYHYPKDSRKLDDWHSIFTKQGYITKEQLLQFADFCENTYQKEQHDDLIGQQKVTYCFDKLNQTIPKIMSAATTGYYKDMGSGICYISCGLYDLTYCGASCKIYKYLDKDPHKRYFWNADKTFTIVTTEDQDKAYKMFQQLLTESI